MVIILKRKVVNIIMKHDVSATANAAATVIGLIYLVCRVAVWLAPDLSMTITQSWFHNIDITQLPTPTSNTGTFVLGLATATAGAWFVGYAFALTYNWFLKKK
jgi:hypothetical protein